MKKKSITLLLQLLFISTLIFAQSITYSELIKIPEISKENLIYNAHTWLGNNPYKEDLTQNVIESSKSFRAKEDIWVSYDVKLEISENEYTYEFYNFTGGSSSGGGDFGYVTEEDLCFTEPSGAIKVKMVHKILCKEIKKVINEHIAQKADLLEERMTNKIEAIPKVVYKYSTENLDPPDGIVYKDAIKSEPTKKDELYRKSRAWFYQTYDNADEVLQINDEKSGIFLGEAGFEYSAPSALADEKHSGIIRYKILAIVSGGELQYTISDFEHPYFGMIKPDGVCFDGTVLITAKRKEVLCEDIKSKIDENAKILIQSLTDATMKADQVESENNNNWIEVEDKGGYIYTTVVEAGNLAKDELYEKVIEWLSKEFVNANRVLEVKDKSAGELFAKGSMKFKYMMRADKIYFDIMLQLKDNAYKYSFFNFTHKSVLEPNLSFGYIYDDEEACFVSKKMTMFKKQKIKACATLKEKIEAEVNRLVSSMAETLK